MCKPCHRDPFQNLGVNRQQNVEVLQMAALLLGYSHPMKRMCFLDIQPLYRSPVIEQPGSGQIFATYNQLPDRSQRGTLLPALVPHSVKSPYSPSVDKIFLTIVKLAPGPERSATNPSGVISVTAHEFMVARA